MTDKELEPIRKRITDGLPTVMKGLREQHTFPEVARYVAVSRTFLIAACEDASRVLDEVDHLQNGLREVCRGLLGERPKTCSAREAGAWDVVRECRKNDPAE